VAHGAEMEIDNPGMGAASIAMSFGAKPKLIFIFRWWAVLMGLASIAAALPVGMLSFGCDGAAKLFLRVRPLRDAYEFLSGAYGRASIGSAKKFCGIHETPLLYD
jgi:hypothetical protein